MCTCTMGKLGNLAYNDKNLLYKYKNTVEVPPVEMVDDKVTASKCGNQVVSTSTAVNTFVELKNLELSETKCSRIHVGKNKCHQCPPIMVNKDIKNHT